MDDHNFWFFMIVIFIAIFLLLCDLIRLDHRDKEKRHRR